MRARVRVMMVGGALLALALGALAGDDVPDPQRVPGAGDAHPLQAVAHAGTSGDTAASPGDPGWAARVRTVVDRRVAEAGATLSAAEREEIVTALLRVRRTGERTWERPEDDRAAQEAQARIVVRADKLLRDRLGYGLAEFVAREAGDGPTADATP